MQKSNFFISCCFIKSCCFTAIVLFFLDINSHAQDPIFTQFYSNPVYLNPAFSGTNKCPRFVMNYRNQWPSFPGAFVTTAATFDKYFESLKGGLGLSVMSDQVGNGVLVTNQVSFSYAYHQHVSRTFTINYALQGSYIQKAANTNKMTFGDQIHSRRGFVFGTQEVLNFEPVNFFDFSAGILGYSENFFIGFAAHHLLEPDESLRTSSLNETRLPMRYTIHLGTEFDLASHSLYTSKGESLSPSILLSKQAEATQINLGLYYKKGNYVVGLWYRNRDSFILTLGLETEHLRIGYSYDITTSQLTPQSGGSHEVSLAYKFFCKPKQKSYRTMSCPSF